MATEKHKPHTTNKPGIPVLPGRNPPLIQPGPPKNVPTPAPAPKPEAPKN